MAKSNFLENAILNHVFRGVAFPSLTNVHVALFTDGVKRLASTQLKRLRTPGVKRLASTQLKRLRR